MPTTQTGKDRLSSDTPQVACLQEIGSRRPHYACDLGHCRSSSPYVPIIFGSPVWMSCVRRRVGSGITPVGVAAGPETGVGGSTPGPVAAVRAGGDRRVAQGVWAMMDVPAGKRMAPFLAEIVGRLRACGELRIGEEVAVLLTSMSAATIDRRLAGERAKLRLKGPFGYQACFAAQSTSGQAVNSLFPNAPLAPVSCQENSRIPGCSASERSCVVCSCINVMPRLLGQHPSLDRLYFSDLRCGRTRRRFLAP